MPATISRKLLEGDMEQLFRQLVNLTFLEPDGTPRKEIPLAEFRELQVLSKGRVKTWTTFLHPGVEMFDDLKIGFYRVEKEKGLLVRTFSMAPLFPEALQKTKRR